MGYIRKSPWYWFESTYPAAQTGHGAVNDAFGRAVSDLFTGIAVKGPKTGFMPRLDLSGDEAAYYAALELPGVSAQDISLEVKDNSLIIQGEKKSEHKSEDKEAGFYRIERSYGSFRRVIALPEDVDQDAISASSKDGVLTVTMPRRPKTGPESRKIEIAS